MASAKTTTVSRQVLEETPTRTLTFLRAVGTTRAIAVALRTRGYDAAEHKEGWALLHRVSGYDHASVLDEANEVNEAIAALSAWDEPNFRIIHVTLARQFPEQAAFVFHDLAPTTGAGVILSVKTLLDRLDALEDAPERKGTRKADHAALKRLAKKGYTAEERARVRALLAAAQGMAGTGAVVAAEAGEEERRADLERLRGWYVEWAETARIVIKRRDHLIRLGLAKRKPGKGKKGAGGEGAG